MRIVEELEEKEDKLQSSSKQQDEELANLAKENEELRADHKKLMEESLVSGLYQ